MQAFCRNSSTMPVRTATGQGLRSLRRKRGRALEPITLFSVKGIKCLDVVQYGRQSRGHGQQIRVFSAQITDGKTDINQSGSLQARQNRGVHSSTSSGKPVTGVAIAETASDVREAGTTTGIAAPDSLATESATGCMSSIQGAQAATRTGSKYRVYMELSKARLSSLVVMTTGAGFLLAGPPFHWGTFLAAAVGTSLAASSANTFNQLYEVQYDKLMKRTMNRPLPSGRISKKGAAMWGLGTGIAGTSILAAGCNPITAALGALNIGLYAGVYTPMKQRMELNTWVGAVVGAIPPVMGYTAATGALLSPEAALAGSLLFLWQFPHFFALAWRLRKDYARGGFAMVPCADPTGQRTAKLITRYSLYLAPLPILAYASGVTTAMFAAEGLAVNGYLLAQAIKFKRLVQVANRRPTYLPLHIGSPAVLLIFAFLFFHCSHPSTANANKVFYCSLWYLPVMLGLMVFHQTATSKERVDAKQKQEQQALWSEALVDHGSDLGAGATGAESFTVDAKPKSGLWPEADSKWEWGLAESIAQIRSCLNHLCLHSAFFTSPREGDKTSVAALAQNGASPTACPLGHVSETMKAAGPASHLCPVVLGEEAVDSLKDNAKDKIKVAVEINNSTG